MIPRLGVAVATAVLALVLTACSDSDGAPPSGSTDASESASASASDSGSPTETASTATPVPEVAPATGPVIKVKGMRVNVPQGWQTSISVAAGQTGFPTGVIGTLIGVNLFPNSGLYTIDELGDEQVNRLGKGGKRLDDLEVDGFQIYHLVGSPEAGLAVERFGTIVDDQRVALEFRFGNRESRAERDEIIQSVLATARLG